MLDYLVTSTTRRRLLELLWKRGARGSIAELARQARLSYAGTHRELHEMVRFGLATRTVADGHEVFAAAVDVPDADLVRRLVAAPRRLVVEGREEDGETRGKLRALGAPLLDPERAVDPAEREEVLVAGVALARRDPRLARVLPIAFWKQRDVLDPARLEAAARHAKQKRAVGFFLALTGRLAGDRKLARLSAAFVDGRVSRLHPFFELPSTRAAEATAARRTPGVAKTWGFTLNLDLDSFQSQFDKHTDETLHG